MSSSTSALFPTAQSLQLKTDFTGKGTLCFGPYSGLAVVTLLTNGGITVHASPDYATTGTSNTVTVRWPSSVPQTAVSATSTLASLVAGQPDTVDVMFTYVGAGSAQGLTVEIDQSGVGATIESATADAGSCTGTPTVTCSLSDLPSGGHASLELKLDPNSAGQLSVAFNFRWHITARTSAGLPTTSPQAKSGSMSLPVTAPSADLGVALKAAKARVGKPANVTILLHDAGPQGTSGSTLSFVLPKDVRLVRVLGTGVECSVPSRTCTVLSLAAFATAKIVLSVIPLKPGARWVSATIAVGGASDPLAANNIAKLTLAVLPEPAARR